MARTDYELACAKSTLKELSCRRSTAKDMRKAMSIAMDALSELSLLRTQHKKKNSCEGCEGRASTSRGETYQCLYCCRNYGDKHDMIKKGDFNYGQSENGKEMHLEKLG